MGDVIRCHVIAMKLKDHEMSAAEEMQRMFLSIQSLEERARTMPTKLIRDKIKTEYDKYIGRGRRKRTTPDVELLNACRFYCLVCFCA